MTYPPTPPSGSDPGAGGPSSGSPYGAPGSGGSPYAAPGGQTPGSPYAAPGSPYAAPGGPNSGSPYAAPGSPYAAPGAPTPPPGGSPDPAASPYGPPPGGSPYGVPPNPYAAGPTPPGAPAGPAGPIDVNKLNTHAIISIFLFWPLCFAIFGAKSKVEQALQVGDIGTAQAEYDKGEKFFKYAIYTAIGWYVFWCLCCGGWTLLSGVLASHDSY